MAINRRASHKFPSQVFPEVVLSMAKNSAVLSGCSIVDKVEQGLARGWSIHWGKSWIERVERVCGKGWELSEEWRIGSSSNCYEFLIGDRWVMVFLRRRRRLEKKEKENKKEEERLGSRSSGGEWRWHKRHRVSLAAQGVTRASCVTCNCSNLVCESTSLTIISNKEIW